MGCGTEFFFLALGGLVLGPKRLHTVIGHVTQAKHRFGEMTQAVKSQVDEELDNENSDSQSSPIS